MKKLFALLLALCLLAATAALAEEDDFGYYPDDHPECKPYVNNWAAEKGDWRIEMYGEDGSVKSYIVHQLGDDKEDIWEYALAMNADNTAMTSTPFGLHYKQDTETGDWDVTYYEDGEASFTLDENGHLLWADLKEDAGKGLVFEKIGNFFGGRWMKGNTEVVFSGWRDGVYEIRCLTYGADDQVLSEAAMKGVYDPETDTLTAEGALEADKPITVVFSYDEMNNVVWTENGESFTMEYSYHVE